MYKVKVNNSFNFDINAKQGKLLINDAEILVDERLISGNLKHILYKNKSYNVEVVSTNMQEKSAVIKVNGNAYMINIEDQFDQLLKQLGMDNLTSNKVSEVKAPMPGLVLNVLIEVGSEVKKGDSLLVLEAMKMENILKSPSDGKVKAIKIINGDKVEKNQVLVQFA